MIKRIEDYLIELCKYFGKHAYKKLTIEEKVLISIVYGINNQSDLIRWCIKNDIFNH